MNRPDSWTADDEYLLYWCTVDLANEQANQAAHTARLAGYPAGSPELRAMEAATQHYKQLRRDCSCHPTHETYPSHG